jgi:hypothetical protein
MTASQKLFYLAQRRYERYMRALGPLFWLPMRDRAGDVARNHAYAGGVSAEKLVNGDFATWSGGNPTGWNVTEVGDASSNVVENPAGVMQILSDGTLALVQQNIMTVGDTYRVAVDIDTFTSGQLRLRQGAVIYKVLTAAGVDVHERIAAINGTWDFLGGASGCDVQVGSASIVKIGELDGRIAGTISLDQVGQMGVSDAFLMDGSTSLLTIVNRAAVQGLDEFSLWMLFNPASAGEGDAGVLFSKSGEFELRFNSASRDLTATVNYDTTNAIATTTTALTAEAWQSVGLRIDDTSKQIDIFIDGVEASYASRTSGAGSRVSNTNDLIIGNNAGVTQTLDGLLDEAMMIGRTLTEREWLQLHRLAGLD